MRIHQLVSTPSIILTNEESKFVNSHPKEFPISSLYNRDHVIAQTLVRKGVYEISNDSKKLILKHDDEPNSEII
jgi:hypothetical protein